MQINLKIIFALGLIMAANPIKAHHQDAKASPRYTVYWKVLSPKSANLQQKAHESLEIWKVAFVSTIQLGGSASTIVAE